MKKDYDNNFTVIYEVGAAHVDFSVYEIIGHEGKLFDVPIYEGVGGCGFDEKATTDIAKANKYLHGTVKWDGCSHLYFGAEEGYLHLCGSRDFIKLSELLKTVYKECYELGKFDYDKML